MARRSRATGPAGVFSAGVCVFRTAAVALETSDADPIEVEFESFSRLKLMERAPIHRKAAIIKPAAIFAVRSKAIFRGRSLESGRATTLAVAGAVRTGFFSRSSIRSRMGFIANGASAGGIFRAMHAGCEVGELAIRWQ